jgi:hypothetical protein
MEDLLACQGDEPIGARRRPRREEFDRLEEIPAIIESAM